MPKNTQQVVNIGALVHHTGICIKAEVGRAVTEQLERMFIDVHSTFDPETGD